MFLLFNMITFALLPRFNDFSYFYTQVKGLQNTVQGADGKITLLQFQLQKAKRISAAAPVAAAAPAAALTLSPIAICTDAQTLDR